MKKSNQEYKNPPIRIYFWTGEYFPIIVGIIIKSEKTYGDLKGAEAI